VSAEPRALPPGTWPGRRRSAWLRLQSGEPVVWRGCQLVPVARHQGVPVRLEAMACPRVTGTCPAASGVLGPVPCRRGWLARALARAQLGLLEAGGLLPEEAELVLTQLARSPEPWARVEAARDPACPSEVVGELAADWWWEVRAAVAARRGIPPVLARALAQDPNDWVRRALAENPDTDPEVLGLLHADPNFGVRDAVAEHPATPPQALLAMVQDPVWEIRRSLAKRRQVPTEVLVALRNDPEHWVRFFVACHPATPPWVRQELTRDPRPSVRAVALRAGERARRMALALGRGLELPPGAEQGEAERDEGRDSGRR
jgi:hypothetical protein